MNVFNEQQKQAITTFISLQNVSIGTEKEIRELIGLVNRWNKQWPGLGSPGQGNGGSNMNGSTLDWRKEKKSEYDRRNILFSYSNSILFHSRRNFLF